VERVPCVNFAPITTMHPDAVAQLSAEAEERGWKATYYEPTRDVAGSFAIDLPAGAVRHEDLRDVILHFQHRVFSPEGDLEVQVGSFLDGDWEGDIAVGPVPKVLRALEAKRGR
jgi:hypothetical protein